MQGRKISQVVSLYGLAECEPVTAYCRFRLFEVDAEPKNMNAPNPFQEEQGASRFDKRRNVQLLVRRKLGANKVAVECSSPLGMLMIAEHVTSTEFRGVSRRRNIGLGNLARAISFDGISLLAWTTDGALIIERDSILPSVLLSRHKEHNDAVMTLAKACKVFAQTKELPGFRELSEPAEATANGQDWVLCPNCGRHFALKCKNSWNGDRHITCGKRLTIVPKALR